MSTGRMSCCTSVLLTMLATASDSGCTACKQKKMRHERPASRHSRKAQTDYWVLTQKEGEEEEEGSQRRKKRQHLNALVPLVLADPVILPLMLLGKPAITHSFDDMLMLPTRRRRRRRRGRRTRRRRRSCPTCQLTFHHVNNSMTF